ncbi:HlyD family efflux transporter periplasmic adaptor subunit [Flavobacterium sp. LC2016-23]|uniref:HlyD family secretion protein n=1 Tax=Flavobacterium sp. LC2016-23 TaxID=2666330 RepID=UPI0012B097E1|nr:HlyD family efflux transporter periplasmic adaptor subunit [Flavobacterium sp. LC2016-23]MRX38658.1 HlyD family efflux transporter periplasmic adaptor subunit [Flavobacterium sp. LC2016-23]
MSKTGKIDIQSEVVRDYLEQIPNRLVRWGSFIICAVLLALFVMTCFLQYPSVVNAECRLNALVVPKPVIIKINGRIERIFVKDNQKVVKNQVLGYVESTAKYEEVSLLNKELNEMVEFIKNHDLVDLKQIHLKEYQNLGEIQTSYQNFQETYVQTLSLFSDKYYKQIQGLLKIDIKELNILSHNLQNQKQVLYQDLKLQEREYQMNKTLHKSSVIADADLFREESKLLSKKEPINLIETELINNTILIRTKEKEILDLTKLATQQKEIFKQSLNTLRSVIAEWNNRYVFYSPNDGEINFINLIQEKTNFKANTEIMYVSSPKNKYKGEIKIPQDNFGKVKIGQTVLIKFKGYPYEEYGMVEGKVQSIAKIPSSDDAYFYAAVNLLNNGKTTNGQQLNFRNGMLASAEIITENLTFAQRIFYSFRRNLKF